MNAFGISAYYHDSTAVLSKDVEIVAAVQEKRFTRKQYNDLFSLTAVEDCLNDGRELIYHRYIMLCFIIKPFLSLNNSCKFILDFLQGGDG